MSFSRILDFYVTVISGALDALIDAYSREMAGPLLVALVAWWILVAYQFFFTNDLQMEGKVLFRRCVAMSFIVMFVINAARFRDIIKGLFWQGLSNKLNQIAASAGIGGEDTAATAFGLTLPGNAGTDLDVIMAHAWEQVAKVWGTLARWDVFGMLACGMTLAAAWLQCVLDAVGYVVADFVRGMLIGLGPAFFALALFDYTKPFFDRWIGKVVSLILVKLVLATVTVMTVQSSLIFLDTLKGSIAIPPTLGAAAQADGALQQVAVLVWIIIICLVGTLVQGFASYIAYSIGGGGGAMRMTPAVSIPSGRGGGGGGGRGGSSGSGRTGGGRAGGAPGNTLGGGRPGGGAAAAPAGGAAPASARTAAPALRAPSPPRVFGSP